MQPLLLEIGTEEIPAGYIEPALAAMAADLSARLERARVFHGKIRTLGTPRRLAVIVENVAVKQKPKTETMVGPPVKVAVDADGNYTVPAQKFAEKAGVALKDLVRTTTEKGEYLAAEVSEPARPTKSLLPEMLAQVVSSIPFPRSMRWADRPMAFARPIHTLAALFGKAAVPFTVNGVKSGRKVRGHFFMHGKTVSLARPEDYEQALEQAWVIADMDKRTAIIRKEVAEVAAKLGGRPLMDERLLNEVKNLVEYPVSVGGRFDEKFLEVPRPVLISAMEKHQKYFPVVDEENRLLPAFVAVNNTLAKDPALTARGHERVLRARLSDARFFFETDRGRPLADRVPELSGVLFTAALGTMEEKAKRVERLAAAVAKKLFPENAVLEKNVRRAALLCKADLVTEVVGEFPDLQGVMGRIYALADGEPEPVAAAVEEHYRPTHAGGALPETPEGVILALADKMDTICGCFAVGLVPTGGSDPYALRRQAIGMVSILVDRDLPLSLEWLADEALAPVAEKAGADPGETRAKVLSFFADRMAQMLVERGYARDLVSAAAAAGATVAPDLWQRTAALSTLKDRPDFEELAAAFKRVVNIIRQAREKGEAHEGAQVNPDLFQKPCESELFRRLAGVREKARKFLAAGEVEQALKAVASLKGPVDEFFDGVLVLAPEESLRKNRLALLGEIAGLFARFADFSRIST
ncbi:MAG: glycine--tRNA ligase subunit beta [Deltaproteobacteria bacterium]|nr:glycine--tRNA ligase subunit beta [Deltaproteobacteria bacterium]